MLIKKGEYDGSNKYYNFNNNLMKSKVESASSPNHLISKRHSLGNDKLAQPYKIDWGTNSIPENRSNSNKNFFQNMKNELTSIKNDFEKLLKK